MNAINNQNMTHLMLLGENNHDNLMGFEHFGDSANSVNSVKMMEKIGKKMSLKLWWTTIMTPLCWLID